MTDTGGGRGDFGFELPHDFIPHNYIVPSICNYCLQSIAGLKAGSLRWPSLPIMLLRMTKIYFGNDRINENMKKWIHRPLNMKKLEYLKKEIVECYCYFCTYFRVTLLSM